MRMMMMLLWRLGAITISTPENKISDAYGREEDVNDIDCLLRKQLPPIMQKLAFLKNKVAL